MVDNPTDMLQGSSTQFKVLVSSFGKVGDITLSSDVGSSGINCTFEPAVFTSNFSASTVTINVPDSTPPGNYTVSIVASGDGQHAKISSVLSVLSANLNVGDIVVSGRANSAALFMPFPSSLISITFTDTQTDANTTYDFNFPPPPTPNPFGNYTVILMNQHTYNVTVSYYGNMDRFADYVGKFTVAAPAGQTAIIKDF